MTAFSTDSDTASLSVGACSISGFVYIDVDNDGLMAKGSQANTVLQGVLVKLYDASSGSELNEVVTGHDGSYHFDGLGAGSYRVAESQPSNYLDGKETVGTVGGVSKGTVGADQFVIPLTASDAAVGYNFGEAGLKPSMISLSMSLASATASASAFATVVDVGMVANPAFQSGLTCTVTATDGVINAAKATSTGFTISGATIGATFQYSIASSGGGTPITSTGAITSATQQVTGIDVSSLPNGTLTISVTLSSGGATGPTATATATLDQTAPSGYAITADDANVNAASATATGFTIAGAEVNATYTYTITSSAGGTALAGSGTINSAAQDVSGIDVSSLPDGTLTYDVFLTDSAGNAGSHVTASAVLDRTAPTGYTITPTNLLINSSEAASTGFTVSGGEEFTNYSYTISSDGDGGVTQVTGGGVLLLATQLIDNIDVSSLPDGTLTFSVTLTDDAGNVGPIVTATATLDTTAPSGYSISVDQPTIDASTELAASFTFANAEFADGTTYSYTVTSSGGGSLSAEIGALTAADQQVTGIDVSGLMDGTLTFTVTVIDAAGNVGAPVTATAVLERGAPTGYGITLGNDAVNAAEAGSTSFTFAGAEIGSQYDYTITSSGGGTPITGSGTITSTTQQITGIDVSSLPDGTLTFSVILTDTNSNIGDAVTATATLDQTPPSGYSITVDQDPIDAGTATDVSFTFAGAEEGATYSYTITSDGGDGEVIGSGTVLSTSQQITGIDVSSLPSGLLTFTVTLTDAAGNVGVSVTDTATLS